MKRLLLVAAGLSLVAAPAFAQSTVNLGGTITPGCTALGNATTNVNIPALGTGVGELNASAITALTSVFTSNASVVCNGIGAKLTVTANPLQLPAGERIADGSDAAAAGFASRVDYTANVFRQAGYISTLSGTGPSATAFLSDPSNVAAPTAFTLGLTAAQFRVGLSAPVIGAPVGGTGTTLVAGAYSGSVVIAISPTA